jgi:L-iditol 2-dehydrogenase
VLLQVTSVGLCGSDRHWFVEGGIGGATADAPLVLGHEVAAVIADGPEAGMRVVLEPAIPCGRCATCRSGRPELCPTATFAGYGDTDGGLRTVMTWPRRLLHPIPPTIGDDEAALIETLGVALHAVYLAAIDTSTRVAVLGCGPIGLLTIQAVRAFGVTRITAIEPLAHRAAAAAATGATIEPNPDAIDAAGHPGVTNGQEGDGPWVDVAIDCSGEDAALLTALGRVRPGGRVVVVGIPDSDRTTIPASVARRKGLTLVWCRRTRSRDLTDAIELVASGRVDVGSLISHRFGLDDVAEAFAVLVDRSGHKVIVRPGAAR